MRLFEAIIQANHAAAQGRKGEMHLSEFADSLPLAALTCIDPRLNKLFPEALGVDEERFIWLRNAGNVITSSTSSTVRSVAIAVFLKSAKEIAVIGHTDCKMSKFTMMNLLDQFQAQGIDRASIQVPNLQEFFGLFSSETQNVIKSVGFLRQSPFIPPKIPVHGLVIHTDTGRLDWIVNGYETLGQPILPGVSLKEFVTGRLPPSVPSVVSEPLGAIAEKVEPLVARKWETVTTKIVDKLDQAAKAPPKKSPPPKK